MDTRASRPTVRVCTRWTSSTPSWLTVTPEKTTAEWVEICERGEIPCMPVADIQSVDGRRAPEGGGHVRAHTITRAEGATILVRAPVTFSESPCRHRSTCPALRRARPGSGARAGIRRGVHRRPARLGGLDPAGVTLWDGEAAAERTSPSRSLPRACARPGTSWDAERAHPSLSGLPHHLPAARAGSPPALASACPSRARREGAVAAPRQPPRRTPAPASARALGWRGP